MRPSPTARLRNLGATVASLALVISCGGTGRSTEAFCDTLESEQARILDQFTQASGGDVDSLESALAGLGASVQALGELRTYFEKLSKVAPPEIQTEVEIIAREYDQMLDSAQNAASNPLGALAGGLMSSFELSGPINTVDDFAMRNCGQHL